MEVHLDVPSHHDLDGSVPQNITPSQLEMDLSLSLLENTLPLPSWEKPAMIREEDMYMNYFTAPTQTHGQYQSGPETVVSAPTTCWALSLKS